ncbi:MAG TPA: TolC family protein [Polyangiaceae bacterium]|jgi:outer membrane protein TolC|nr:TolC family protein [Polyangiaceae bacterium]
MRLGPFVPLLAVSVGMATTAAWGAPDSSPVPAPAPAEAPPPSPATPMPAVALGARHAYTLAECLRFAESNYPKVHEAGAQLDRMRAQLFEVRMLPFGGFTATAGVALAPTVSGTAFYSPNTDAAITSSMALAWRVGIDGAVPLWTFGKISNAIDAAKAQVKVGEENVQKSKNEVRLTVRQAFYGVELARDARSLVDDALERVDKYLPRVEEKVKNGDGDDIQLLKLKIHRAELIARRSEAERQERVALSGLRFLTGMGAELDVPDEPLKPLHRVLGPVSQYLTAARLFRPEVNMARAGVVARRAQVELEKARFFPDFALALSASRSYAPEVADQLNPFVRDDANYLRYGFGLVLNWKLDFLPQAARVAQARAQLEEIRATERYALGGVGVEVETAFAETEDAAKRLEAWTDAARFAKQWLVKVQEGIDVGTFNDEDIVDPAKEYALKRFYQMSATLDYNMALAKLALATGWDAVAPSE